MPRITAALSLCLTLCGQPAARPQFEVASIRPSRAGANSSSGIHTGHGRLDAQNVTLQRCIIGAYGVGPHQISGGPAWLDTERFDILAKADRPIDDDAALMAMLQSLLADRFQLALHRETRRISAFVLETGSKGARLEKAAGGEGSTNSSNSNTGIAIHARNTTLDSFARVLSRHTELPVINRTGMDGIYNIQLHWTPERARPPEDPSQSVSLFTAIQEQLGLRLRARKEPVEVLVINGAERPSEN